MPWAVKRSPVRGPKDYAIYRKDTGKIVGRSTSEEKAKKSVRARYAGYSPHTVKSGRGAFGTSNL